MKCIVEIENYEISLKAQVQEDRVICENSTYSYAADVGLLNGQLKVIYSDSNIFIDRTNFTMYKCHLLGAYLNRPDCSLCQRIDQRFDCAWCSGSCQHRSRCLERPDESCPPPRIDFVHPLSGPTLGGTRVTIEGSNLGQSFEEIAGRVTIGNAPCKPIEEEYRPSNRIVCLTSPVLGSAASTQAAAFAVDSLPGDIVVGNRAGYTIGSQKFHFKSVHLHTHQPRYGPQSGGTRITLSGVNLNIGSSIQVFLDELPCLVEMSLLSSEQLTCRTTSSRQASRAIRHLKLIIDDAQIVRTDDVFYYTSDPVVNRVSPLRAYLSGGRPINVFGANLTVVQAPRMAIYDSYIGRKVNESSCVAQDDTWMQCPAPTVNLQMIDLEYAEHQIAGVNSYEPNGQPATAATGAATGGKSGGQRMFQQDESVRFKVGFIMDNVMQTSFNQLQTEIAYTSDPKLHPFASVQYRTMQREAAELTNGAASSADEHNFQIEPDTFLLQPNEPALVLYGEQLRAAVSEYEITVTVGKDLCNLTQLSQTRLVCSMPLDHMASPTDEEGHQTQRALPLVVVRIGFNLRYELGYVQYHPQLVAQIDAIIANLSASPGGLSPIGSPLGSARCLTHPIYKSYMPCENESALRRLSSLILSLLMVAGYALLGFCLLALIYTGLFKGLHLKDRAMRSRAYKNQLARFESLERSLKNDCRVASLALQGDLNELVRHIELSGVPLLNIKHYIMKVFFPGINNHPLLLRSTSTTNAAAGSTMLMVEQHPASHPSLLPQPALISASDLPMEQFERLLLTKPFLLSFINTLERQPSFTIRDKVNVASLLMIVLMERLDYATDIMKTLLFQLVDRSVNTLQRTSGQTMMPCEVNEDDFQSDELDGSVVGKTTRRLTRRASNLLSGLPISKRHYQHTSAGRLSASQLGKVVNGGASSLIETTSVAAQMLLARVGHKTSPLASEQTTFYQQHQTPVGNLIVGPLDCHRADGGQNLTSDYMSTTAFNDNSIAFFPYKSSTGVRREHGQLPQPPSVNGESCHSPSLSRRHQRRQLRSAKAGTTNSAKLRRLRCKQQAQLMLRRTESIVEKMLTNWLALTMHDQFQGPLGQSLYLLFEALRSQLERGPIDAISGDAYYSLSEHKLLREPNLQFDMVNLYVIVDTDILQANKQHNLLFDNTCPSQQLTAENLLHSYQDRTNVRVRPFNSMANNRNSQQACSLNNTINLALRVLDCDIISQVKSKILSALYRNAPHSSRVGPNDVELSLRRHHSAAGHQTLMSANSRQQVTVVLQDYDLTSVNSYNSAGPRQLNTLRHYGVTDQGIMLLKRAARINDQQAADGHYSNPYAEIQYGQCKVGSQNQPTTTNSIGCVSNQQQRARNSARTWHLTRFDLDRPAHLTDHQSNDSSSSPASHSPSMMLLGAETNGQQISLSRPNNLSAALLHQQQFYHPSSSSTSSTGNVMDTHSTSANSNSIINNMAPRQQNLLSNTAGTMMGHQDQSQQPIYCQIGSISAQSQHAMGPGGSQYYCQIGASNQTAQVSSQSHLDYQMSASMYSSSNQAADSRSQQENNMYLARMLTSKGTIQKYIDNFFTTILTARSTSSNVSMGQNMQLYDEIMTPVVFGDHTNARQVASGPNRRQQLARSPSPDSGSCPPTVKWIFDLLDEAASKHGITDENVIHAWKSNAFLLRFWVNFIKNPDYILDVDKSNTLDASLSVIAQTLMDACTPIENQRSQPKNEVSFKRQPIVCSQSINL